MAADEDATATTPTTEHPEGNTASTSATTPTPASSASASGTTSDDDEDDEQDFSEALDSTNSTATSPLQPTTASNNNSTATLPLASAAAVPATSEPAAQKEEEDSFTLIASLRSQITDLTSQVTSLNTKLVKSYTSIGDLEDEVHETKERARGMERKVGELEEGKKRWEREIEGGGWVERDHVQGEMQRLMSTVLEETASRKSAVEAHSALETEIENLTSTLFDEANKMVVFERVARARAEEKMKALEESGATMQVVFDEVQVNLRETVGRLEEKDKEIEELQKRMISAGVPFDEPVVGAEGGKDGVNGKKGESTTNLVVGDGETFHPLQSSSSVTNFDPFNPPLSPSTYAAPTLLTTGILPYVEFLSFITYLRQLRITVLAQPLAHPAYPHPYTSTASSLAHRGFGTIPNPASTTVTPTTLINPPTPAQLLAPHLHLSTHLSQPFLKRCIEEDSDPTIRLDLAPGLGFLSRRTVQQSIIDGTLLIEPLGSHGECPTKECALCGEGLEKFAGSGVQWAGANRAKAVETAVAGGMRKVWGGAGGWFNGEKKDGENGGAGGAGGNKSGASTPAASRQNSLNGSTTTFANPFASGTTSTNTNGTSTPYTGPPIYIVRPSDAPTAARYAVCPIYCLSRLRSVCEFWNYVRVIERGLLLEEGFRFVQGRKIGKESSGANGGASHGGASGAGLGIGGVGAGEKKLVVVGGEEERRFGGGPRRESLQLDDGKEVEEVAFDGGELPVQEEDEDEDEEDDDSPKARGEGVKKGEEKKEDGEKAPTEGDEAQKKEEKVDTDDKKEGDETPASPTVVIDSTASTTDEAAAAAPGSTPTSPAQPTSPNSLSPSLTSTPHGSTTSLAHRPPVPPRSNARPASPNPNLPPRPPRHPKLPPSIPSDIVQESMGWEDRCWSEVVRLKEAVFWSRMAARGSDGEGVVSRLANVK